MRNKNCISIFMKRVLYITVCTFLLGVGSNAQAVLIDFDDITYVPADPEWPQFYDHPLTDEYLSQGLLIDGGSLVPYNLDDVVSAPNFLFGGNFMRLIFTGAPTYVSMHVNGAFDYANILHVYGPDGLITRTLTSGEAGSQPNRPHISWEFVSFSAPGGITEITLEGFFNMRWGTLVDDLRYEYASVPAPSSLALVVIGLLGVSCLRKRER